MSELLILSTDTYVYAHKGIIGLGPEPNKRGVQVFQGYDGIIDTPGAYDTDDALTAEECCELADIMIERWQAFRKRHEELKNQGWATCQTCGHQHNNANKSA